MANTASRDSHEVRKRENERQALAGLARCRTEDARPAARSTTPKSAPRQSASGGRLPGTTRSARAISASNPSPPPELTVKKMMLSAGFIPLYASPAPPPPHGPAPHAPPP